MRRSSTSTATTGTARRTGLAGAARTRGSAPTSTPSCLGGSMYELEPGDRLWPYHTHHANEEWLDRPPRSPDAPHARRRAGAAGGRRRRLPRGKEVCTRSERDRRADPRPDALVAEHAGLVEYPDSGKVGARSIAGERILLSRPGPISTTGTARRRYSPNETQASAARDRRLAAVLDTSSTSAT